jgi:hypothetical protein
MRLVVEDAHSPPRPAHPTPPAEPEWFFTPKSPVTILVVAQDGYRCGYDPAAGETVNDFEGATYTGPDAEPQVVTTPGLGTGADTYEVIISPKGAGGAYTLEISHRDSDGSITATHVAGAVGTGEDISYSIERSEQGIMIDGVVPSGLAASIDIEPDSLNERSCGLFVTAYIELPDGVSVCDIDPASVRLNDTISPRPRLTCVKDHDYDGRPELMVKFSRRAVAQLLDPGMQTVRITGSLKDGRQFAGTDTIEVVDESCPCRDIVKDWLDLVWGWGSQ